MPSLLCLSGGWDSSLLLKLCEDIEACVYFSYGQENEMQELKAIETLQAGNRFQMIRAPLPRPSREGFVWTGRNLAFIAAATMIASQKGLDSVIIGCNASDAQHFPDCRPAFWNAVRKAYSEGRYRMNIRTPLIGWSKAEIISKARKEGLAGIVHTCYQPKPEGSPCGECHACVTEHRALAALRISGERA